MKDREAYIQKLHARLDEWNADIDRLKAKADKIEAESRLNRANHNVMGLALHNDRSRYMAISVSIHACLHCNMCALHPLLEQVKQKGG